MSKIRNFFKDNIVFNYLKILLNNFQDKNIEILSYSLTYVSAFAIFPLLAMIIVITKGFGFDKVFIEKLIQIIPNNEKILYSIIDIIQNLVLSVQSSVLSIASITFLVWTILKVLLMLEDAFNDIWKINKGRSYKTRIINYIAIIFMIPIFIILFVSSSNLVIGLLEYWSGNIRTFYIFSVKILNVLYLVMLFTGFFNLIPNEKINIKYSFYSAIITTIAVLIISSIYTNTQIYINKYNAIYGSLAFVPLFLIWAKYTWTFILIGAEINYIFQMNKELINNEKQIPSKHKNYISLYLFVELINQFKKSKGGLTIEDLYELTGINSSIIKEALNKLENAGYIYEITIDEHKIYHIKINPDEYKISEFMKNIEIPNFDTKEIFEDLSKEDKYINFYNQINIENNKKILEIKI